jgi:hypothetical protein
MTNLPRSFDRPAQATTQTQRKKRFKATTDLTSELEPDEASLSRPLFPIWQITVPLCTVLIFAIGSLTAYSMVEGRYLFDLSVSREQIRIRTDVDKRESSSAKEEGVVRVNETEAKMPLDRTEGIEVSK